MKKVQKNVFTDYNAPSSEPFRLHLYNNNDLLWIPQNTQLNLQFRLSNKRDTAAATISLQHWLRESSEVYERKAETDT
jgi:hypothetical protein